MRFESWLTRALVGLFWGASVGGCAAAPADDAGNPAPSDAQSGVDAGSIWDVVDSTSSGCSPGESQCKGNSLEFCDPATGQRKLLSCTDTACQQDGFKGSLGCGLNAKGAFDCLCQPCTPADNVCLNAGQVQTCNLATGRLSVAACPTGQSCAAGQCKAAGCTPSCSSGACGPGSDGCGGTCSCAAGEQCVGGTCQKTCTKSDSACQGDVLFKCESDGLVAKYTCSQSNCVAAGYIGYSKCGLSSLGEPTCLCTPCTADNNQCLDGKVLQTCDLTTGKLKKQTCAGSEVCFGGACVDPTCKPKCDGTTCGPDSDGCGGTCNCGGSNVCDNGYCVPPCSKLSNFCLGDELQYCTSDGTFAYKTCSAAECIAAGYPAYAGCGPSASGESSCLCKPCTKADNTCIDLKTAQVCDATTGKLAAQSCPANAACKAGSCQVSCANNEDCAEAEYCVKSTGACKALDGATYSITIVDAEVFGSWGDTPDPYVEVRVNGTLVCSTAAKSDTYYAFWFATCSKTVALGASSTLEMAIYDEDVTFDDFIGKASWTGASLLALLKDGGATSASIGTSGTNLTFYLDPQ